MTKTIDQSRRDGFEMWVLQTFGCISFLNKSQYGGYEHSFLNNAWLGYNAAIESLCVTLPDCDPGEIIPYGLAIEDCREAIHAAGVRTK